MFPFIFWIPSRITFCPQLGLVSSDQNDKKRHEVMNDKNLLCNCKMTANHCYSWQNVPGIMSEFSECNTRWSCNHTAGSSHTDWHGAVATFTTSIYMLNTRNTAGWSYCRPLCVMTLRLVFDFFSAPRVIEKQTIGESGENEKNNTWWLVCNLYVFLIQTIVEFTWCCPLCDNKQH